jgi:hypothetical protein
MGEFNPNEILLDMQTLHFSDEGKEKLENLRKNLYYCAPELLGNRFFNGYNNKMGLCAILSKYTTDEIASEVNIKYDAIVNSYKKWKNKDSM